jgi:hypothetical protein
MLAIFSKFPTELGLVGHLLLAYGELEFDLMHCVSVVRGDLDAVLKTMDRARGETQRLDIAGALGRPSYGPGKCCPLSAAENEGHVLDRRCVPAFQIEAVPGGASPESLEVHFPVLKVHHTDFADALLCHRLF